MSKPGFNTLKNTLLGLLALWFLAVSLAAYGRIFDSASPRLLRGSLLLGLCAVAPILLFAVWFMASAAFREYVLSINPTVLTAVQTWRIAGIVFIILCIRGFLPGSFAYPAGFGDMAIGLTAPFIAYAWSRNKLSARGFVFWQALGMTDLIVAVTTGVLSSPSKIGILAHGTTTRLMGLLPLSLIPTFAVPLLFILHIICIAQIRRTTRERAPLRARHSLNPA